MAIRDVQAGAARSRVHLVTVTPRELRRWCRRQINRLEGADLNTIHRVWRRALNYAALVGVFHEIPDGQKRLPSKVALAFCYLENGDDHSRAVREILSLLIGWTFRAAGRKADKKLVVDVARRTATWHGRTYDLRSEQTARWLKVLADHPGQWFSSHKLYLEDPRLLNPRTDRLKNFLPEPIRALIESEARIGSRLKLT